MVDAGVQIPLDALDCRGSEESGSEAQPAERLLVKQRGVGSNPTRPLTGLEDTEGLADSRRRQPPAKRPTREGLQVRPLSLPLGGRKSRAARLSPPWRKKHGGLTPRRAPGHRQRSCSWESSRSPKPAEWVRILPALLGMRCPVTQRVWRPVCRTGETGSSPVQGADIGLGTGR